MASYGLQQLGPPADARGQYLYWATGTGVCLSAAFSFGQDLVLVKRDLLTLHWNESSGQLLYCVLCRRYAENPVNTRRRLAATQHDNRLTAPFHGNVRLCLKTAMLHFTYAISYGLRPFCRSSVHGWLC